MEFMMPCVLTRICVNEVLIFFSPDYRTRIQTKLQQRLVNSRCLCLWLDEWKGFLLEHLKNIYFAMDVASKGRFGYLVNAKCCHVLQISSCELWKNVCPSNHLSHCMWGKIPYVVENLREFDL